MLENRHEAVVPLPRPQENEVASLTESERDALEFLLDQINHNNGADDESAKIKINAEQGILSIGKKALPFLVERLVFHGGQYYKASKWLDALSSPEHIDLILNTMSVPGIYESDFNSDVTKLLRNALLRQVVELRDGWKEKEVSEIAEKLKGIITKPDIDVVNQRNYLTALMFMGDKEAEKLAIEIGNKTNQDYSYLLEYNNTFIAHDIIGPRTKFKTWEEFQAERGERQTENGTSQIEDPGPWDDLLFLEDLAHIDLSTPTEVLKSEDLQEIAFRVNELVEDKIDPKGPIRRSAASAIKFHLYNVYRKYPNDLERQKTEMEKMYRLSDVEYKYSRHDNPLPTIGIEVEIPRKGLVQHKVDILDLLKIKNTPELYYDLHEVNPDYSHSPLAQSRVLQELYTMGAIPEAKIADPLSLHINFGFLKIRPNKWKTMYVKYTSDMQALNDILIAAFTSAERINVRKTNTSLYIKDSSDKYEDDEDKPILKRLELRANEFSDYKTFRLLAEAQAMAGSLIQYIMVNEGLETSEKGKNIGSLWFEIREQIISYLDSYGLKPNSADNEAHFLIHTMQKHPDFNEGAREIVSKFSKRILKEVFPENFKL